MKRLGTIKQVDLLAHLVQERFECCALSKRLLHNPVTHKYSDFWYRGEYGSRVVACMKPLDVA